MKTLALAFALVLNIPVFAGTSPLQWLPWSDAVFSQAKQEKRFVLLDLEAVWCHWCHVMDETTYKDAAVIALFFASGPGVPSAIEVNGNAAFASWGSASRVPGQTNA